MIASTVGTLVGFDAIVREKTMCLMVERNEGYKIARVYEGKDYSGYLSNESKKGGSAELTIMVGSEYHHTRAENNNETMKRRAKEISSSDWLAIMGNLQLV